MATIVPRWEWRTFGASFPTAEDYFSALDPIEAKTSDDLYLVGEVAANVKIRDDLVDVKVLKEVDSRGLELWTPMMKVGSPIPANDVLEVFAVLERPAPDLARDQYTMSQFLEEVVAADRVLQAVQVHKTRVRYQLDDCIAEVTDLDVGDRTVRTIAIEGEHPDSVISAVDAAGLGEYLNVSYTTGLRSLIAGAGPRYAVIDIGTNSVKFHLGELQRDGQWAAVVDRAELTRLGEGLEEHQEFQPSAIARTVDAVIGMVEEAKDSGARAIAAVGTAGLRIAPNRDLVTGPIRARTGVKVEVISGEEEGRLAYLAVEAGLGLGTGSLVVFDTGGGSSQFTFGEGAQVIERFSVQVGAVRYTETFALDHEVDLETVTAALAAISADLDRLNDRATPNALVGMGGAITNITAVSLELAAYDPDLVQGATLDIAEIDRQIDLYRGMNAEARRSIVGLQPKRAEVILAGACIVRTIMEKLGQTALTVSDRGLRHGLLIEKFGPVSR
ncbi:MAG TPA: Ppx/GppA family phosphatase [Acidimicrobiia bacterium]